MSGLRCLRSAFDACRPTKSSQHLFRPAVQWRSFADSKDVNAETVVSRKRIKEQPTSNKTLRLEKSAQPNEAMKQGVTPTSDTAIAQDDAPEAVSRPIPANVIAAYRAPLKHPAPYGVPVASLQLRSFSVRNLEFFADFALRAAYYLNLPVSGPVPLPKRIERWTMPKSNFIHKKTQENFERITYKRLITVMDGEKSTVEVWLAVLRKWQFFGVGMKANVWEWEGLDVASKMDAQARDLEADIDTKLATFGYSKDAAQSQSVINSLLKQGVKATGVPMTELREAVQRRTPEI